MFPVPPIRPDEPLGLPGINENRATNLNIAFTLDKHAVPANFPFWLWNAQAMRYYEGWRWFDGTILSEKRTSGKDKEVLKYPLRINSVRNFSRKHASILLGEENFDSPQPLVRSIVRPRNPITGHGEFTEEEKDLALMSQNIVNEVWLGSNGRALQMENAILSQFLGGCVFQVKWEPDLAETQPIPISIKNIMPDFFLPVWRTDDYWNLLEAFVIYRIPEIVAERAYGRKPTNQVAGWVTYCEHWTADSYSIYLEGEPIHAKATKRTKAVTFKDVPNPFGFVPFVYIPHIREGNFYGSSIVDDVQGLIREINARSADIGDAIHLNIHRHRFVSDVNTGADSKPKNLGGGVTAINLGSTNPVTKVQPAITTENPPSMDEGLTGFPERLWKQLLREASMGDIAFGEDEGSQRSALTLAFRMWPSTAHARMERAFWTDGLNQIARYILRMVAVQQEELDVSLPKDWERKLTFAQDWLPQIPRDREQQVNEVILRFQAGLISPQRALEMLGDTQYIEEELNLIKDWLSFQASLAAPAAGPGGDKAGAETDVTTPVVTDSMKD